MDADSIAMMVETIAMARGSIDEIAASEEPSGEAESLFEEVDKEKELHAVSVGAFETLKMTADFTECELVSNLCEDLSTDFFEFKFDAPEYITADQGKDFSDWLLALENHLEEKGSDSVSDRLLEPLLESSRKKYQSLFNNAANTAPADEGSLQEGNLEQTPSGEDAVEEIDPELAEVDAPVTAAHEGTEIAEEVATDIESALSEVAEEDSADLPLEAEEKEDSPVSSQVFSNQQQHQEDGSGSEDIKLDIDDNQHIPVVSDSAQIDEAAVQGPEETVLAGEGAETVEEPEQETIVAGLTAEDVGIVEDAGGDSLPKPQMQFKSAIEQEVIEMLLDEMSDLTEDLSDCQQQMLDLSEPQEVRENAVEEYTSQLSKLVDAYDTMGCVGLARATGFVRDNASKLMDVTDDGAMEKLSVLFAAWPTLFARYLGSASREHDALEILVSFQSSDWPEPVTEQAGDDLYLVLIEEFNFAATKKNAEERLETASQEDVDLTVESEVSDNVVQSFLQEAPDLATQFTHTMLKLPDSKDLAADLKQGQRTIHTIKGLASLVGVNGVLNLSHNIEDILEYLMSTEIVPPDALNEVLAESADTLESMFDYLAGVGATPDNAQVVLNDVLTWAKRCDEDRIEGYVEESVEYKIADAPVSQPDTDSDTDLVPDADEGVGFGLQPDSSYEAEAESESDERIKTGYAITPDVDNKPQAEVEHTTTDQKTDTPEFVPESTVDPVDIPAHPPQRLEQQLVQTIPTVPQLRRVDNDSANADQLENSADAGNLTVPVVTVDQLFRAVGEMSVLIGQMQVQVNRVISQSGDIRKQRRVTEQRQFELENVIDVQTANAAKGRLDLVARQASSELDSLEFDQYGALHSTSHAYIETVADIQSMVNELAGESTALRNLVDTQGQLNKVLEELVTSTRLVSSSSLNARMERCVRQASRSTGKKVNLELVGTETLVDSETLSQLVNPLIHVLRNAVDHGIDSTADRLAAGKPEEGQIELRFSSDGQTISVICDDDGGGINYEAIREKMISSGVIQESDTPDNARLASYLFLPGVTTKTEATQLSGRGFGMDIVSETVRSMNGKLEMTNNDKGGCRVSIQIPVKLVTTHALLVEAAGQQFSIPSPFIEQVISRSMGSIEMVGKENTFFYGNKAYPVVNLAEKLNLPAAREKKGNSPSILVVNSGDGDVAVLVDHVIGNHEVVVKSLGKYLSGSFEQVSGVATLGDGKLVSVLNIASLLLSKRESNPGSMAAENMGELPVPANVQGGVLIVEDSLSVRNALSDIVEDAGYSPVLAKDGVQALELLKSEPIGIVLTDLEMPRMDGLELTKQIRSSDTHKQLPVLMITSRTMEKHMHLAKDAGVTEYITKPFSENKILDLVTQHISSEIAA